MIYVLKFIVSLSLLIYVTFAVNAYLRLKVHLTFDHLFILFYFFPNQIDKTNDVVY
jgi:hypothetical protein